MKTIRITELRNAPGLLEQAALWFHQKWGVPAEAYRESMRCCIERKTGIPQWYLVLDEERNILAGAGAIENDFHPRRDLAPNLCALYVEQAHRNRGIARAVLGFVRRDLGRMGVPAVYLITDHTAFYEACGWSFLTMVEDGGGHPMRVYTAPTL